MHDLYDPPTSISVMGDWQEGKPMLAVVGTRRSSPYGKQVLYDILPPIIRAGVGIVSGLAFGIDSLAHKITLEQKGYTAAVLPSSLPEIYPKSHSQLAERIIISGGALISEYSQPVPIHKSNFLARNRLVACLADALLVVEATERSGTTSTVAHALELGRDVMSVPGSIFSPTSRGTNTLIRSGGLPVTNAEDVAAVLNIDLSAGQEIWGEDASEQALIDLLSTGPRDIHELLGAGKLAIEELQRLLTVLELKDIVKPLGNQTYGLRN